MLGWLFTQAYGYNVICLSVYSLSLVIALGSVLYLVKRSLLNQDTTALWRKYHRSGKAKMERVCAFQETFCAILETFCVILETFSAFQVIKFFESLWIFCAFHITFCIFCETFCVFQQTFCEFQERFCAFFRETLCALQKRFCVFQKTFGLFRGPYFAPFGPPYLKVEIKL